MSRLRVRSFTYSTRAQVAYAGRQATLGCGAARDMRGTVRVNEAENYLFSMAPVPFLRIL